MNILAHLYLSGTIDAFMLGNFMGDFVKGKQYHSYPEPIQEGILFHRKIDSITDNHPGHRSSRNRFREGYGLHAGIVVDIVYDHFLASQWEDFHNKPLAIYVNKVYRYLDAHKQFFPEALQSILPFIINNNWLELYKTVSGIERVLKGMARRTSVPDAVSYAIKKLESDYFKLDEEFKLVMTSLVEELNRGINLPVFNSKIGSNT